MARERRILWFLLSLWERGLGGEVRGTAILPCHPLLHPRAERLDFGLWRRLALARLEQREDAWAVQFVGQVAGARHEVDMDMVEVVGRGKAGEILLRATRLRVERLNCPPQQGAHRGELVAGQFVERAGVAA